MTRDQGSRPGCASGTWLDQRERIGQRYRFRTGDVISPGAVTVHMNQPPPAPAITGWHLQEAFEEGLRRGRAGR